MALGAPAHGEDAGVQFPKGLRIGLVPPPGLTASDAFSGFGDPEQKVAIAIAELPAQAYYSIENELFRKGGNQGVTVERRELFAFATGVGFLVAGRQEAEGVTYHKWLLVAGQADFTALVQVQVPEQASAAYPDSVIRAALSTLTFRPTPLEEQLAMLPFRLEELAGFHIQRAMPEGVVVLTDGDDKSADQPHVMVMVGRGGPEQASDHAVFAQRLLATLPGLVDLRLTDSEAVRIGGRPGFEVRAQARDPATGAQLRLIQWLRFGSGGFLRVLGVATDQKWAQAYPRFRAVRDGVEIR
jgi:hypothetical protein